MRDLFAILAIVLAVVSLGIFRVPDENALVAAGIRAEAQEAVYQSRHPIGIEVKGRVITATGRVESDAGRRAILDALAGVEGVEKVVDALTVLPDVVPFTLRIERGAEGVTYDGHLPDEALADVLEERLLVRPDLTVAAGAPDGFGEVAALSADILNDMLEGSARLTDGSVTLRGRVHLPKDMEILQTRLEALPEGFDASVSVEVLDDGLPYSLLVSRDPLMGLELRGKLPPDFDRSVFDSLGTAQAMDLRNAPMPLDQPGFTQAVSAALPVFADLEKGALSIAPGVVTLQASDVARPVLQAARDMGTALPDGFALLLALAPENTEPELSLHMQWDGDRLSASGHVPRDMDEALLSEAMGAPVDAELTRSAYPDLEDWSAPLRPGLAALRKLESGTLSLDADGLRVTGVAADPAARALARRALGPAGSLDAGLQDDGRPPVFNLAWDAGGGGSVTGKLPAGVSVKSLAAALGVDALRGAPAIAPEPGGDDILTALGKIRPWLPYVDKVSLDSAPDRSAIVLSVVPGLDVEKLRSSMGRLPASMTFVPVAAPPTGTRRMHKVLNQAQVFTSGHWLPELGAVPTAKDCAALASDLPDVPFATGRFSPELAAFWPLAEVAALARACTRFTGLTLAVTVEASGGALPELDAQVARRRGEVLRAALAARGVDPAKVVTSGRAGASDSILYDWR